MTALLWRRADAEGLGVVYMTADRRWEIRGPFRETGYHLCERGADQRLVMRAMSLATPDAAMERAEYLVEVALYQRGPTEG